ncbi:MAG TPA: ABC transporter ATP-binding protein [Thermoanaerobaculia bacterium]|nr:ABC transporter ATP-binding protein [Thermoanaerobaculia bacterium]
MSASTIAPVVPELEAPAAADSPIAIRVENLSKSYRIGEIRPRYKTIRDSLSALVSAPVRRFTRRRRAGDTTMWALRDVSFDVRRGDVIGVIGRNGAGKSTLLKVLSRITQPTLGVAEIHGRVGSLLEVGTGFHPELTGRENVFLNGAILGMRRSEIQAKFDEIVAFAEVAKFIDTAVKHYSTGMYLRLAFAVAAHLEPDILLVDEVLAVGDVLFQKKCLGKMEDVARTGRTVLFVSHNMGAVRSLCTKGLFLENGRVLQSGDVGKCIETYFTQIGAFQAAKEGEGDAASASGFGNVRVTGPAGENAIDQSEPFDARTRLAIRQEVSGFSLFCIVEDMQNRMVFHLREESTELGLEAVSRGDYAIQVRIPPLWLNTGLYSLYFKVLFWGNFGKARHVSDKVPLDVTGRHSRVDAILHPAGQWTVRRSEG